MNFNQDGAGGTSIKLSQAGYESAVALMRECSTQDGFLATPTEKANYRRIWGRDSAIIGLAALLTDDPELIETCRRSLETLARYQGRHGEIPSNVDPQTDRVSYGGTAGRVDASLWFVIACGEYWRLTEDDAFLEKMLEPLERVRFLLGCWEFNSRGLLFVPPTGDWADEYLQSGYVLYDQLLYLQAQREFCKMHRRLHQTADHDLDERASRLLHLIRDNYWFWDVDETPDDIYHEVLFEKGRKAVQGREGQYWMPFFSPFGYGFRFDGMANVLATLFGIAEERQAEAVDEYISEKIVDPKMRLLPAFHPVITPKDEEWNDLQVTFSHTFKNAPYEFHNGGLWPLITAFHVAGLVKRDKNQLARQYCEAIHQANRLPAGEEDWSFPEYVHGRDHTGGGTTRMGWSAAASVIAEETLRGKPLFR